MKTYVKGLLLSGIFTLFTSIFLDLFVSERYDEIVYGVTGCFWGMLWGNIFCETRFNEIVDEAAEVLRVALEEEDEE